MIKILTLSLITSFTLISCTTPGSTPTSTPETQEIQTPATEIVVPTTPEATVTSTPAVPVIEVTTPEGSVTTGSDTSTVSEPAGTMSSGPEGTAVTSPTSDVVTPIGTQSNTTNTMDTNVQTR